MKKLWLALFLLSGLVMYFSCTKDHASLPVAPSGCDSLVTYNLRVKNILNTYCASTASYAKGQCHDVTSFTIGQHIGVYVYLYDSAHAANIFNNTQYNAICYVQGICTPAMPYLLYGGIPDSLQTVPADTIKVLQCWISNGCD